VRWDCDEGQRVRLTWAERGGPPVTPPTRKGFGSRLIERSLAMDLEGEARLEYRPEGVVCTLVWNLHDEPGVATPPKWVRAAE
jgi:two-component sensor histidine kinase